MQEEVLTPEAAARSESPLSVLIEDTTGVQHSPFDSSSNFAEEQSSAGTGLCLDNSQTAEDEDIVLYLHTLDYKEGLFVNLSLQDLEVKIHNYYHFGEREF